MAAVPEVADHEMRDVDATRSLHHKSLYTGDSNSEMGMALQTQATSNIQDAADTVEDIDIRALDIIDHQHRPSLDSGGS